MMRIPEHGWLLRVCAVAFLAVWAFSSCRDVSVTLVPVAAVDVVPGEVRLTVDERRQLEAIPIAEGGSRLDRPVEWTVRDADVATIDSTGVVEALDRGVTTVEARSEGVSGEARVRVEEPDDDDDEGKKDEKKNEDDDDDDEDDDDDDDDKKGKKGKKGGKGGDS